MKTALNQNILAALQTRLQAIKPDLKQNYASLSPVNNVSYSEPVKPEEIPLIVTVQRVLNRNRLDVYFNRKPADNIRAMLKMNGFHWNDLDKRWYHQDNEINRKFLVEYFDAEFDSVADDKPADLVIDVKPQITDIALKAQESPTVNDQPIDELSLYSTKVNALCEALNVKPADLVVVAINALYRKTFN